jgi:stage V sporulation protein G
MSEVVVKISEVNIVPVKPTGGLVAFASCVINESLYLGSFAIHTRLDGSHRLVYPRKHNLNIYYPIRYQLGDALEKAITEEYRRLFV